VNGVTVQRRESAQTHSESQRERERERKNRERERKRHTQRPRERERANERDVARGQPKSMCGCNDFVGYGVHAHECLSGTYNTESFSAFILS